MVVNFGNEYRINSRKLSASQARHPPKQFQDWGPHTPSWAELLPTIPRPTSHSFIPLCLSVALLLFLAYLLAFQVTLLSILHTPNSILHTLITLLYLCFTLRINSQLYQADHRQKKVLAYQFTSRDKHEDDDRLGKPKRSPTYHRHCNLR